MAVEREYILTRENAIKAVNKVINEIYDHRPQKMTVILTAGVDEIPMIHVEYDALVYNAILREGEG